MAALSTPLTKVFGIKHPVMLAGMGSTASPELAAAVSNAGGIGTIGGIFMTPKMMGTAIDMLKADLVDKNLPFGVDLLLPQVGGGARKTNYDYTGGGSSLDELADVIIEKGTKLFVCAVGVPPKWLVDKFHNHGIICMNMIGAVKHVDKCIAVGVDIICAQGGEAGGHTGDIATSILIPKVVDACRGKKSPLTGDAVMVVAAGGIFDGRGLASALSVGAAGVWVGTRFVAAEEAGSGPHHRSLVVKSGYTDIRKTLIYSGRPLNCFASDYVKDWEDNRSAEIKDMTSKGKVPVGFDLHGTGKKEDELTMKERIQMTCWPMGQCAGAIDSVQPARVIVEEMVSQAVELLSTASTMIVAPSKL